MIFVFKHMMKRGIKGIDCCSILNNNFVRFSTSNPANLRAEKENNDTNIMNGNTNKVHKVHKVNGSFSMNNGCNHINKRFANQIHQISSSLRPNGAESDVIHTIFDEIEMFDYYDGDVDDESYLTKSQQKMMDELIDKSNQNEPDKMNAFYMVDLGDIIRQHIEWISLLPNISPFYAVKCNPDPIIISLLNYIGCSFDCASKTEFDLLIENGVDINNNNEKVVFSHPCKHPLHLQYASQIGVNLCTFDNEYEIEKIHEFHPECKSLLRIQVDDSQSICKFNSKYGYNVDNKQDIYNIFELCYKYNINLNGIMFHVGSGCLDSNVYQTAIEKSKYLFDIGHNVFGFDPNTMNVLDLGGGFPGINEKNNIQFTQIANVINQSLKYYFNDNNHTKYKFIAEPGRYYVSKSHSLICDIIAKKKIESGFMYYINEGMYGSFNCMYFDHAVPTIIPYHDNNNNNNNDKKYKSTIFGPTCDSMDKMYDNYLLKEMHIMDKLIIPNFGAYTNAASSGFNGFQKSKSRYVMTL